MIADNRLNETLTWRRSVPRAAAQGLSVLYLDFSLETIGFEMGEIDLRIESLNANEEAATEPVEVLVEGSAVTKPGDLWLLGEPSRALRQRRRATRPRRSHGAR